MTSMIVVRPSVNAKPFTLPTARKNSTTAARRLTALEARIVRLARFQPSSTAPRPGSAVAQLVADAFEVDDERVGREADGHDQARDAGERKPVALAPARMRDGQVREHARRRRARRWSRGRAPGTGTASRSTTSSRPIRPAMQARSAAADAPSVAEIVSCALDSKLIGRAPNFSWSASALARLLR